MKLLIIEDDSKIAKSLSDFLKNNHYTVDIANDGETGLYLINSNDYDLIITDYLLPKIQGDEVISQLRKDGNNTPILAISVCDNVQNKINFLENGADDYLIKPFLFSELHARVRALLRRPKLTADSKLSFADLTLNLQSQEATRGGRQIYLTTKEFYLLKILMEHPGITYSRQIITEKVWDNESNPLSNIIEAHILHLRHKIDFKKPSLIQTVPGCGYRLNVTR